MYKLRLSLDIAFRTLLGDNDVMNKFSTHVVYRV